MLTNKEDYIKVIYELGGEESIVSNKKISEALKISPASVSEMIKKLVADGYLEYLEYKGVRLKDKGVKLGKGLRKRHLLWEVFLVDKLGYGWDEVDELAENLEHITDEKLEERLDNFLNNPEYCPHGNPINGHILKTTLADCKNQDRVKIIRVYDDKDSLDEFSRLGLKLGDVLKLTRTDSMTRATLNGVGVELPEEILNKIYVTKEG